MPLTTRFAPSPTGHLHLGHAYSALFGWRTAREAGGRFLLRIENIDPVRCRPEFERDLIEDLTWLGLNWDGPVRRQSEHMDDYRTALNRLEAMSLLYPCFCTRRDVADEIARAGHAPHGPDGVLYPGTCRARSMNERQERIAAGQNYALRLNMAAAVKMADSLIWHDRVAGMVQATPEMLGDVVLARKDVPTSYHLSVTVDDHLQDVSLVTRGTDLFHATHLHRLLQALLNLNVPEWHHHDLLTNANGIRLSKRDGALSLRALREQGHTPAEVREMVSGRIPERAGQ